MINPSTRGAIRKLLSEKMINAPQCKCKRMVKLVDCATKYQKLHEDPKQHNSTFPLKTCHYAYCSIQQNLKDNHLHDNMFQSIGKAIPN